MNQQNAKNYLPIIQAWSEGKTIQHRSKGGSTWFDATSFDFSDPPECYRIKPEPKYRPWKPEEVPLGCWLRVKGDNSSLSILVSFGHIAIKCGSGPSITYEQLINQAEYSTDFGKTWQPCGVLVDEKA